MSFKHRLAFVRSWWQNKTHYIKCWYRVKIKKQKSFYDPAIHTGELPVRVLKRNVMFWLETVSPIFFQTMLQEIQNKGLQRGIAYHIDKQKIIHAARINAASITAARQINTYETFNAYLWCICYSLLVAFDEIIQKPHLRGNYTGRLDEKNEQIRAAINVFEYGMSLRTGYQGWDKSLPNPEEYECKYAYYVERANSLFSSAMFFVLCHEIGHSYHNHVGYEPPTAAQSLQEELDADNFAIDQVLTCTDSKYIPSLKYGSVVGMCALLFLSPKLSKSGWYPDADDRIKNVVERLNLPELDLSWGMASLAFRLWGNYYGISFNTPKVSETYMELFYDILFEMNQIKKP